MRVGGQLRYNGLPALGLSAPPSALTPLPLLFFFQKFSRGKERNGKPKRPNPGRGQTTYREKKESAIIVDRIFVRLREKVSHPLSRDL